MNYASNAAVRLDYEQEDKLSFVDALNSLFSGRVPTNKNEDLADLLCRADSLDPSMLQIYFSRRHRRISVVRGQNGQFLPGFTPFTDVTNDVSCEEDGNDLILTVQGSDAGSFASLHNIRCWMDCGDDELFQCSFEFERVDSAYVARIPNGAHHPACVIVAEYESLTEDDFCN